MLTYIGIGLLYALYRLMPNAALGRLGEWFGLLLYALVPARRHIGSVNLRLCFPELAETERRRLLKAHYRALGRASLMEAVAWWGSRAELEQLVRIEGLEHLERHLGQPLILLAPHFVGLNLGGVRLTLLPIEFASMYRPVRNPMIDRMLRHARSRFGSSELIARHEGIKPALRAIRAGKPFYYLPDQDFGPRDALFVPFFGVPAATVTALSRIARITGARVLPCIVRQDGDGYVVELQPAWADFPGADVESDTRRMNAFIEQQVRRMPEQYFWLHRRFKTRPPGEPPVY
ncbi:MAG: lipid A biosynthesis acyltransferase [Burkholderiales bacterium]|nr:lipid A biosynthesis acyltransferase [Burkholderiales bacterium]